jgi:hypothetical protein
MKKIVYSFLFILMCLYSNAQQFTLKGTATATSPNTYRLTENVISQAGLITSLYPLNLTQNFELDFEFNFGSNFGSGADGIAFLMSNDCNPSLQVGAGLGVGGTPNSLIVECDTYDNGSFSFDIFQHHITIFKNGSMFEFGHVMDNVTSPVFALTNQGYIDNNIWYPIKIKWEFLSSTSQKLSVYFNNVLRVTSTRNHITDSFLNNPNVFYSIGGSTGAVTNLQQVRTNEDSVIYNVCTGGEVTLVAPGLGTDYSWSVGSSITNSNTFTPTSSGTVTCNYIDFCNEVRTINFSVNLFSSFALPLLEAATPICIGQNSSFTITGNQGLVIEFNINNGATQTQTIPASENLTIPVTNPSTNQTLTITKVSNANCSLDNLNINQTITVNPIPVTSTPVQTN